MSFLFYSVGYCVALFITLIIALRLGHAIGRQYRSGERGKVTANALDGVIFALLGLLLGFSFSNALTKYGTHRDLLATEAMDIQETFMLAKLLPQEQGVNLQAQLKHYAQARLRATQAQIYSAEEAGALLEGKNIQKGMWDKLSLSVQTSPSPASLSALVASFTKISRAPAAQLAEQRNRVPGVMRALIFILATMAALIAGYSLPDSSLPGLRMFAFAVTVCITMYVIIDMASPRSGFFNAASENRPLQEFIQANQ